MKRLSLALGFIAFISYGMQANEIRINPNAPQIYTVKKGDTLWDIAGMYLSKPWFWPKLWEQNPEIEDPHWIYPGDKLYLTWDRGVPKLTKVAANSDANRAIAPANATLASYLNYDMLVDSPTLELAPRVLGDREGLDYLSDKTPFFVDKKVTTKEWFVYRPVLTFTRKLEDGSRVEMMSLKQVAHATLTGTHDDMSEFVITKQLQEVRQNDVLLPAKEKVTGNIFNAKPLDSAISGQLIGHLYGSRYVGLNQVVVVDLGEQDGVSAGNEFNVLQQGATIKGKSGAMRYRKEVDNAYAKEKKVLPEQVQGRLLVVKSYPYFSLAMVVDARQPLTLSMPITGIYSAPVLTAL